MKKKSGFTIIEVALVLGIAGLIMILAFFALPSLWSSQRDADRRANVMNFISALKTYQTNNSRGALPEGEDVTCTLDVSVSCDSSNEESWSGFLQQYYTKNHALEDPGGVVYTVKVSECGTNLNPGEKCTNAAQIEGSFDIGKPTIYVVKGATCNEENITIVKTANKRSVAAVQVLEKGKYCHNT